MGDGGGGSGGSGGGEVANPLNNTGQAKAVFETDGHAEPERAAGGRNRANPVVRYVLGFAGLVELAVMRSLKSIPFLTGRHSSLKPVERNYDWTAGGDEINSQEEAMASQEVEFLMKKMHTTGSEPSPKMLKWLALKKCCAPSVTPELVAYARSDKEPQGEGKGDLNYTVGHNSLAMQLYRAKYQVCDVPHDLLREETNVEARNKILKTALVDPECDFRKAWDAIQVVLLLQMAVALPMQIGFRLPDPVLWSTDFWIAAAVDLYFVFDVYLSFVTCIYDEAGLLIISRRVITARYCKGWFLLDMLSCAPVGYVAYFLQDDTGGSGSGSLSATFGNVDTSGTSSFDKASLLKLFKVMRLIKLLRLGRLARLLVKYQEQFFELYQRVKALKLLMIIGLVGHWLACVWFYVGTEEGEGWVVEYATEKYGANTDVESVGFAERYLVTYWMAVGTLIAGMMPTDIYKATILELVFGMLALTLGGFVYGSIVADLTDLARKRNM
jgi:hypothetical protein